MKVFANQIGAIVEGDIHLEDASRNQPITSHPHCSYDYCLTATIKGNKIRALVVHLDDVDDERLPIGSKRRFFENYNLTLRLPKNFKNRCPNAGSSNCLPQNYYGEFGFLARLKPSRAANPAWPAATMVQRQPRRTGIVSHQTPTRLRAI